MKLTTFFISRTKHIYAKNINAKNYFQNKGNVTLDTFRNSAYISSYLQTKVLARKRDCAISSKLRIPRL